MTRTTKPPQWLAIGLPLLVVLFCSCGRSPAPLAVGRLDARTGATAPIGLSSVAGPGVNAAGPIDGHAVVVFNDGAVVPALLQHYGLTEVEATTIGGVTFHLLAAGEPIGALDLVQQLVKDKDVAQVFVHETIATPEFEGQPMSFDDGDGIVTRNGYPDPYLAEQVNLDQAQVYTQGDGARIAILDTGIEFTHPVFAYSTIIAGNDWSILPHGNNAADENDKIDNDGDGLMDEAWGHGTHVAGIAHMVAPKSELVVIKVLNDDGWGTCFGVASAIVEAIERGAKVINLSVGMTESDPMVAAAVEFATHQGIGIVASAGNQASTTLQYPASYDGVCSVTAVNSSDQLAAFANHNASVDMSAPGKDVISTFPVSSVLGAFAAGDGTSMAAPFVTGTAALVLSLNPGLSGIDAVQRTIDTSHPVNIVNPRYAGQIGHGRVDVYAAVGGGEGGDPPPEEIPLPRLPRHF